MTDYKEILRLKGLGISNRQIARSLGYSRDTVDLCIKRADEKGIGLPVRESVTNEELSELLYCKNQIGRDEDYLLPDFEHLAAELKRPHVTKGTLWTEYVAQGRNSGKKLYQVSQFNMLLREHDSRGRISLRQDHNPGEVLELDWTGSSIDLHSRYTDQVVKCHLFVAAFPFSSYFYAEAFTDEKIMSWVTGISNSLSFFGGVPVILRPDNCKTATIKADKYEPELNTATIEIAKHYNTAAIPARIYRPRDKNVVESTAGYVSRQIIAVLRNQVFFSMDEMSSIILEYVDRLNSEPFKNDKEKSRLKLFSEIESRELQPLPPKPFELLERHEATVAPDYHIEFDHCFYSVPSSRIGDKVMVKASLKTVRIYCGNGFSTLIAEHGRCAFKGQKSTLAEHVPDSHVDYLSWSGSHFRSRAHRVGPKTHELIDRVLRSRDFEVQAYRTCQGILSLEKKYGRPILEMACADACSTGVKTYKGIRLVAQSLKELHDQPQAGDIPVESPPEDLSGLYFTHGKDGAL